MNQKLSPWTYNEKGEQIKNPKFEESFIDQERRNSEENQLNKQLNKQSFNRQQSSLAWPAT